MKQVEFEYYLGDNVLKVLADVTPGKPAQIYGPPENCYPAEDAEVELLDIWLIDETSGNETQFDPDGVYVKAYKDRYNSLEDELEELAVEKAHEE